MSKFMSYRMDLDSEFDESVQMNESNDTRTEVYQFIPRICPLIQGVTDPNERKRMIDIVINADGKSRGFIQTPKSTNSLVNAILNKGVEKALASKQYGESRIRTILKLYYLTKVSIRDISKVSEEYRDLYTTSFGNEYNPEMSGIADTLTAAKNIINQADFSDIRSYTNGINKVNDLFYREKSAIMKRIIYPIINTNLQNITEEQIKSIKVDSRYVESFFSRLIDTLNEEQRDKLESCINNDLPISSNLREIIDQNIRNTEELYDTAVYKRIVKIQGFKTIKNDSGKQVIVPVDEEDKSLNYKDMQNNKIKNKLDQANEDAQEISGDNEINVSNPDDALSDIHTFDINLFCKQVPTILPWKSKVKQTYRIEYKPDESKMRDRKVLSGRDDNYKVQYVINPEAMQGFQNTCNLYGLNFIDTGKTWGDIKNGLYLFNKADVDEEKHADSYKVVEITYPLEPHDSILNLFKLKYPTIVDENGNINETILYGLVQSGSDYVNHNVTTTGRGNITRGKYKPKRNKDNDDDLIAQFYALGEDFNMNNTITPIEKDAVLNDELRDKTDEYASADSTDDFLKLTKEMNVKNEQVYGHPDKSLTNGTQKVKNSDDLGLIGRNRTNEYNDPNYYAKSENNCSGNHEFDYCNINNDNDEFRSCFLTMIKEMVDGPDWDVISTSPEGILRAVQNIMDDIGYYDKNVLTNLSNYEKQGRGLDDDDFDAVTYDAGNYIKTLF